MNTDITNHGKVADGPYLGGADLWKQVPDFDYRAPDLAWVLSRQSLSLALLTAWAAGSILLAWRSTHRLRVE